MKNQHLEHALVAALMMSKARDTTWTTHLGQRIKVRDMEDGHIVNLVRFMEYYRHRHPAAPEMLPIFRREMKLRGLTMPKFQVPYHDGNGNLIVWDFVTARPKIVGRYTIWTRVKEFFTGARKVTRI